MDRLFAPAAGPRQRNAAASTSGDIKPEEDETATQDEIDRLLKAWEDKEYFEMLHLPAPTADAIGQAVWSCTHNDISRAYRKHSILVHPDKNPGEKARQAFEALNQVYKLLRDPNKMEDILKKAAEKATEAQERKEARALPAERIQINSERLEKAKGLREKQGKEFHDRILQQMKRRQHEARRKRGAVSHYRPAEDDDSQQDKPSAGANTTLQQDEDDEEFIPVVQRKKKKPTFI